MKFAVVAILALGIFSESFGVEIKNYEVSGNLESKNNLGCIGAEKITNKYTPADLYKAVSTCANENRNKEGVLLYALAGVYGRFDIFRVADNTAHQAAFELQSEAMESMSKEVVKAFRESLYGKLGTPEGLAAVCKEIMVLGPPNYYPDYMILHGMAAFKKDGTKNAIVADFDAASAWKKSLDTYLHCPGL